MQIFISIIMTLLMFFGTGSLREEALSYKYQNGSWSGSSVGIPTAEVKNGLLYVGGEVSDYPADSSVSFYVEPIVTTDIGTWFLDNNQTNSICVLRLDKMGRNIKEWDFSEITFGAKSVEAIPNDETREIELNVTYPEGSGKGRVVYYITYDPADQSNA